MKLSISVVLVILLAAGSCGAEMYRWVGDDGSVTFKDTPPPAAKQRKKTKVYSDADFAPAPSPSAAPAAARPARQRSALTAPQSKRFTGTIEMYVTDWCPTCKMAKQYIAAKNYPVAIYDIEKDQSAEARFRELGGHGVPLILVGSKRMSGFSAQLLEQYLGNE